MLRVFSFLLSPSLEKTGNASARTHPIVDCIVFLFVARILFAIIIYIEKIYKINGVRSILKTHVAIEWKSNYVEVLILTILFMPIIEEISFRGILTRHNKIAIYSAATLITVLINFIYLIGWENPVLTREYRLIISIIIFLVLLFIFIRIKIKIAPFIESKVHLVFWVSVALFAVVHIPNYDIAALSNTQLLYLPIVLIPYISIAISLSYLRVQAGLAWAILLHCIHNLFAILPELI